MFPTPQLDAHSEAPLYRQLHDHVRDLIRSGKLARGQRLPATRELAGLLGLNRATVSAAYELLEAEGLIHGHVGRGSFVSGQPEPAQAGLDWDELLPGRDAAVAAAAPATPDLISFANSRPSERLFPVEEFRCTCHEVLGRADASAILQLGAPAGYGPLRHYLLEDARQTGLAGPADDILVTSGCQQALDLLQRVLVRRGDTVLLEDPVYPGLKNLFLHAGAELAGVPVGPSGMDLDECERQIALHRPRLIVATSNFQNPTGATLPAAARLRLIELARGAGAVLVENDIYGELRYQGEPVPTVKELDQSGDTVILRSFSKVTFPGLRVGWVIGPRPLIARLTEAKQLADLHTDQLSQAALLRFAESGRLAAHKKRMLAEGAARLRAVLDACAEHLPRGAAFTRPQGGMNLWVRLPAPLDAAELLPRAHRENVTYLPGKYFEVARHEPGSLRLSFAGLEPDEIRKGLAALGAVFAGELERARAYEGFEPAVAIV